MMRKYKYFLPVVFLAITFQSCVSIKPIAGFSTASSESLKQFESIPYGFRKFCIDNCIEEKVMKLDFNATDCDCRQAASADSVTRLIYMRLSDYLAALVQLTGKDVGVVNTGNLTKTLAEGNFGSLTISKDQADAYAKISSTLLNIFTENKRKKELKKYVTEADSSFTTLINFLDFNLSQNLGELLNNSKRLYRSNFFTLVRDSTLSVYEKRQVMVNYYDKIARVDGIKNVLQNYSQALETIRDGHQQLAANIDKLSGEDLRELLAKYTGELKEMISTFKSLNQ